MLIVIEGLDGTGKTTLAKALSRATGLPVIKLSTTAGYKDLPKDLPVNSWVEGAYTLLLSRLLSADAICDRGVLSGIVYGVVSVPAKEWALKEMAAAGCKLIYLDARNDVIAQRDPEWHGREAELCELRRKFGRLLREVALLGVPVLRFDTTNQEPIEIIEETLLAWRGEKA